MMLWHGIGRAATRPRWASTRRCERLSALYANRLGHAFLICAARAASYFVSIRIPYFVVFREFAREIQIIAVAHAKRRPGYWNKRL
jgi:hypothetical protein